MTEEQAGVEGVGDASSARGTAARHAKRPRNNPAGLIAGVVASVLVIVLVSAAAVGAVVWNTFSKRLEATIVKISETDAPPPDIGAIEGGFNILIVGSDTREGANNIDGSGTDGVLNDVNILLHVAQDQQSAVVVSFPRDLRIPYPDCAIGGDGKINSVLYWGELGCVVETVSGFANLPIQFAAMVTFSGVIEMSDAIGGVDVCVGGPIQDENTGLNLPEAGTYNLQGYYALAFLRTRGAVGDGSDLSRVSSQQVFLSSLIRKIKSDGTLGDLGKLLALAQSALANMTLSASLADAYTMVQIALALKNIPLNRVTFTQFPTYGGDTSDHHYFFPSEAGFTLFDYIRVDQPFVLPQVGDDRGSTVDPNGTLTPEQQEQLADNSGLPVLDGVTGQTAADFSCSVPYYG